MKRFFYWGGIILLILIFFAAVIYLPEIDAMILERQYMKEYVLVKQDKQEQGIHYELPLADKLFSLYYGQYPTEIMSIHSITNLESQDEALLEGLQKQVSILEKAKLIPELVDTEQLRKGFHEALYYNIGTVENPSTVVSVWKLVFYDEENFQYEFIIDAGTYKIYSANLYGYGVYDFWLNKGIYAASVEKTEPEVLEKLESQMGEQLRIYYEAQNVESRYLNLYDSFGLEEMLFYEDTYLSYYDKRDVIEIPCQVYYIQESMEGVHIGITDILENENAMPYDDSEASYGK